MTTGILGQASVKEAVSESYDMIGLLLMARLVALFGEALRARGVRQASVRSFFVGLTSLEIPVGPFLYWCRLPR